jgi:hypothetical protein
MRGRRFQP